MADSQKNNDSTKRASEAESPLKAHKSFHPHDAEADHEDELAAFSPSSSAETDKAKDIADELDEASKADEDIEPIIPPEKEPYTSEPAIPTSAMTRGFTRPKRHRLKMILVVGACMLLAAAGAAYGTYYHYKKDINKPARVVTQTKIVREVAPAPTTAAVVVKLDKLGVQYPLNDQTSDWISAQQTIGGQTVASLSSRKLIEAQLNYVNGQKTPPVEAMTQCAVERSPLGHLDMYMKNNLPKTVGAGADWAAFFSAQQSKGFVADLSDRYVMYTHQQSACSDNNTVAQLQTQLSGNDTVKALLKTLTLIK